jgi:diguanylate cyclase (GGDEF)-like protein
MTLYVSSLLIACGICLFAGVHAVLAGTTGKREPLNQAFGCLSLLLAGYLLLAAAIYQADALSLARQLIRLQLTLACLIYPAAVWFLGLYAELRQRRRWLALASLVFGALLVINLLSSNSVIYTQIIRDHAIALPWGEQVHDFAGRKSKLFGAYFLAKDAIYVFATGCCIALWRRHSARAWPLTLYLLIQGLAAVHADIVNRSGTQMVTFEALAFLALVLLMGDRLRLELSQRATLLTHNLEELREETRRRQQVESTLRHLAYHDPVTGLPNRLALRDHVQAALAVQHTGDHALILLDLDHFRIINEALGHDVGDMLLKAVAARLLAAAPAGSLVARHGGDEFALHVGLPSGTAPAAAAREIVRGMTATLTAPYTIGAHDLAVGVSAGIALLPGMAGDVDSALRQVAVALHRAKASGRNTAIIFEQLMQAQADRRLLLEKGLRLALERDEFELHYQPQLDARGRFVAAEALLRWRHPQHGLIAPGEFIPIAEETGLIHAIGRYVLHQACLERESWAAVHADARVSINVSPWQLFAQDFVRTVHEAVNTTRTMPRNVTIEITENALLHDLEDVAYKMRELASLGFHFALDDFGSGYASLGNLKRLPLHELKIDRVFVEGLQAGVRDPLVEAIINIAHEQQLFVVAEGVETGQQREALAELGCDAIQGYLICRPMPSAQFHHWLDQLPEPVDLPGR